MSAMLNRYVWVYASFDKKRHIWEWSSWQGVEGGSGLGIPTPHKKTFARNGVRYHMQCERDISDADAIQIVRSLYEFEFATARVR